MWAGAVEHQLRVLARRESKLSSRNDYVTTSYGYDGRGMISSVRHRNDDAAHDLAFRDYRRDNRDRIVAWKRGTDSVMNLMENGRGDRYGYDDAGQLTFASYSSQ